MPFVKTASRALLSFRHDRHKYTRGSAQIIPVTPSNYPISNKTSIFKHSSHQQIPRGDGRLWETMVSLSFGAMLGHTFDGRKPATFQEVDKKIWLASLLKRRGGVQNSSLVLEHNGNIDRGAGGLDIHFSSDGHARPVRPSPEVLISGLPRAAVHLTSTSKFSL
jgi:hypothetical protein